MQYHRVYHLCLHLTDLKKKIAREGGKVNVLKLYVLIFKTKQRTRKSFVLKNKNLKQFSKQSLKRVERGFCLVLLVILYLHSFIRPCSVCQYVNILTSRLSGKNCINFLRFFCLSIAKRELDTRKKTANL